MAGISEGEALVSFSHGSCGDEMDGAGEGSEGRYCERIAGNAEADGNAEGNRGERIGGGEGDDKEYGSPAGARS